MTAERQGLTRCDFVVENHGTICLLYPQNDWAGDWLYEHLTGEITWWGGGVVVEPRYLEALVEGIEAEGGVVE